MRVLTVIGARPQFVKAATVSRVIKAIPNIEEILVHTGQHYDNNMSQIFFDELDIPRPHYLLEIGSASHGKQTAAMLEAIESVLLKEQPDYVLVYGDTNSTLAGALAAVKLHIPVVHVEAGLRSFNRAMPEEINRIVTDHTSEVLCAPSHAAVKNLQQEGLGKKAFLVGDVMYDAVLFCLDKIKAKKSVLQSLGLSITEYCLCTIHRAENTDSQRNLSQIVGALNALHSMMPVVLPLHPRTKAKLQEYGLQLDVHIIDPVGYLDMLWLTKRSKYVITDSGGLQKEAAFCHRYCITLREETEWVELVDAGVNTLVPPRAISELQSVLNNYEGKDFPAFNAYGNGEAAKQLLDILSV